MDRFIPRDAQWDRIEDILPVKASDCGVTAKDNRLFVEAVLWIGRTGAPWRDLPAEFGAWHNVYVRFARRRDTGAWQRIATAVSQNLDMEALMIDSRSCGRTNTRLAQKKAGTRAIGRSRGGLTTKIHAAVDALGNPVRAILAAGQEADAFVAKIESQGARAVIPPRSNRVEQRPVDWLLYKDRNLVERFFNRLKQFRRIATRYDKLDTSFLSFICLACSIIWLL